MADSEASSQTSKRKSLLQQIGKSFKRSSKDQNGASVKTLRGQSGADFEGKAKVNRPQSNLVCGCFGSGDDEPKKVRYVLIKGAFCFVFASEDAPSPKYAISLAGMKTKAGNSAHGAATIFLTTDFGDVSYTFIFETTGDADIAKKFARAVANEASIAQTEMVKKRLGHAHLIKKHQSVRYAEGIAIEKLNDQPEAPLTSGELMDAHSSGDMPMY